MKYKIIFKYTTNIKVDIYAYKLKNKGCNSWYFCEKETYQSINIITSCLKNEIFDFEN